MSGPQPNPSKLAVPQVTESLLDELKRLHCENPLVGQLSRVLQLPACSTREVSLGLSWTFKVDTSTNGARSHDLENWLHLSSRGFELAQERWVPVGEDGPFLVEDERRWLITDPAAEPFLKKAPFTISQIEAALFTGAENLLERIKALDRVVIQLPAHPTDVRLLSEQLEMASIFYRERSEDIRSNGGPCAELLCGDLSDRSPLFWLLRASAENKVPNPHRLRITPAWKNPYNIADQVYDFPSQGPYALATIWNGEIFVQFNPPGEAQARFRKFVPRDFHLMQEKDIKPDTIKNIISRRVREVLGHLEKKYPDDPIRHGLLNAGPL